ncbi:paeninodin family lasso peptide [Bacillus sp. UMB0893]|uniref:paeninodin family lasso peptide n=1 Tax=Bacillus sp. UMB0893 TaxID=2066053 RepID=UPI001156CABD|nr:paeninodin family lasso peptide [Bacillus sp. UMB0893]QNG58490.1 paeninodin family lasso peptide [Bacillus sp. PAMC26568]
MKKEWQAPVLEVLDVKMTMASTVHGPYTDEAYVPGTPVDPNNQGTWKRFTS